MNPFDPETTLAILGTGVGLCVAVAILVGQKGYKWMAVASIVVAVLLTVAAGVVLCQ